MARYRKLVMLAMDGSAGGDVTRAANRQWATGWQHCTAELGRQCMFRVCDGGGGGRLSPKEQRQSQGKDFLEASGQTNQPMDLKQFSAGLRINAEKNDALTAAAPATPIYVFTIPAGK